MAVRAMHDLQVLWEEGDVLFYRGWRDGGDGSRATVLAVVPAAEPPTPGAFVRRRFGPVAPQLTVVTNTRPCTCTLRINIAGSLVDRHRSKKA